MRIGLIAIVAAALFPPAVMAGRDLSGAASVIDGDTIVIAGTHVRLAGIDAPEHDQTCRDRAGRAYRCGAAATAALVRLARGGPVDCAVTGADRYGRSLAVCRRGGAELNRAMVAEGWALAYRRYSSAYVADEAAASAGRRGLWAGSFTPPWDFRHAHAAAVVPAAAGGAPPDPRCAIKGNISKSGRIYHLPGSADYARTRISTAKGERWFCSEAEALAAGWRARR